MNELTALIERTTVLFKDNLQEHKEEIFFQAAPAMLTDVQDIIGHVIDRTLDENSDDFATRALLYCMQDQSLFTQEPRDRSCVAENKGETNAVHCVYHNVYDLLHDRLERAFDEWHRETVETI